MAKFKVITPFNFYKRGDIVGDAECSKYGPQYFERLPEDSNDTTPKQNDETAGDTNETPAADLETKGEVSTEPEAPAETTEPDLDEMTYLELKDLATSKGLEFKHNISKADLLELLR